MRLVYFFVFMLSAVQPAAADTITIAADEWCPYNCAENSNVPGFVVEIAKTIFESHGHDVRYIVRPWARALKETALGYRNAVIGVSKLDDTSDFILATEPIGKQELVFITTAGRQWTYQGMESLSTITLGVARDYTYGSPLDEYIAGGSDKTVVLSGETPFVSGLMKLHQRAVDALIEDKNVARYEAQKAGADIREAGSFGPSESLYLGFAKVIPTSAEFARIFSDGLRDMRRSGQLAQVLKRYNISDWDE